MERCSNLDDLLLLAGVNRRDYEKSLLISKYGNNILLKRNLKELNVNQYNPNMLRPWKANMDLQYVVDPYSCVVYIISYLKKSEQTMSHILDQVSKEVAQEDVRSQLKKIGSAFLTHREVDAQEAVYRILSLPLKQSSHKVVFVNTNTKRKPYKAVEAAFSCEWQ